MLYEPPFRTDDSHPGLPADFAGQLARLVAAGRRGDAVELYQTKAVGIPPDVVSQLRHAPFRPGLEAIAHTLAYDATTGVQLWVSRYDGPAHSADTPTSLAVSRDGTKVVVTGASRGTTSNWDYTTVAIAA